MTKQFRVSTTLPRKLQELGLSPEAVLRRAGLPMGLFKMDKILVSTEEFFALHRGIAEASNDQGLGLKLGTEERLERYDPVKIAAISARSFRDSPVQRRSVSSNEETSPLSSSSGSWRTRRSRTCWWMYVLRGSSLWGVGVLGDLSFPSG